MWFSFLTIFSKSLNPIRNPLTGCKLEALKWKWSNLIICGTGRTPANLSQEPSRIIGQKMRQSNGLTMPPSLHPPRARVPFYYQQMRLWHFFCLTDRWEADWLVVFTTNQGTLYWWYALENCSCSNVIAQPYVELAS